MKTPGTKPHWHGRQRHISKGRMAWYGEPGNEHYWYKYWKARLTPDYYASAEAASLAKDELGRIFLKYVRPEGLHLEAGCGAGYWVAALRHRGYNIEGIENARELVELVHTVNPHLPVQWGDALAIDRPDNFYNSYLSIGVVEHRVEGPEPFLLEAYRVLKPGGTLVIAVPHLGPTRRFKNKVYLYDSRRPTLPFFQYGFSSKEFTDILRKAGFCVTYVQPLYAHRLLLEELAGYTWLTSRAHFIRWLAERLLYKRDGHMLLVVAQKPEK